jgi:antitoxin component YwqK of YwqJK toxin-antitoxin module
MIKENIAYHKNGNLKLHYPSLNGFYHGIQKWYYPNGQLGEQYIQIIGFREGFNHAWNNTGERRIIKRYKKDLINGPIIKFRYGN